MRFNYSNKTLHNSESCQEVKTQKGKLEDQRKVTTYLLNCVFLKIWKAIHSGTREGTLKELGKKVLESWHLCTGPTSEVFGQAYGGGPGATFGQRIYQAGSRIGCGVGKNNDKLEFSRQPCICPSSSLTQKIFRDSGYCSMFTSQASHDFHFWPTLAQNHRERVGFEKQFSL